MKNLHEFDSLALAQSEPEITTKLMSGDQMRIHMVTNGLYGYFKNHTADPQMAAYDNMYGGEFNFIDGHSSDITPLYLAMINDEADATIKAALTNLLAQCQEYCNRTTYPYTDITEEEYNAAVALNALYVETENVSATYPANYDYLVKTRTDNVRVLAEFVEPVPADLSIPVYMGIRNAETDVIAWDDVACGRINIKEGNTSAYMTLTSRKNSTTVHVVFKTVCPISTEHSLAITVA